MGTNAKMRARHLLIWAIAVLLGLGMLPGVIAPVSTLAQADELSQRDYEELIDAARESDPIFGPDDGDLELFEDELSIDNTEVEVADFLVEVTFQNPYAASIAQFDYGIVFRAHSEGFDFTSLAFIVLSDGSWGVLDVVDGLIEEGTYRDLDDSRRGENTLSVYADGDLLHLGINGDYVGTVEAPYDVEGAISVISGFLQDSFLEDAVTEYTDFTIWELSGAGFPDAGDDDPQDDPADDEPAEAEAEATEYESETYGYTLSYDDSWDVITDTSRRDVDTLEIDNGTSSIQFVGTESDQTPSECVDAAIEDFEADDNFTDVTVALDEDDTELRGDADDEAFVVLQLTAEDDDGPMELTLFYECITIEEGESLLQITHVASSADYNDEIENRIAVLETLELDGGARDSDDPEARDQDDAAPDDEEDTDDAAPEDEDDSGDVPPDEEDEELPAGSFTIMLEAVESDGPLVFGTVVPDNDESVISLIVLPVESSIDYDVTINSGTCRRPGDVEFEVGTVDEIGLLEATVEIPADELGSGDFIMIVSDGGDPEDAIACGVLEPLSEGE